MIRLKAALLAAALVPSTLGIASAARPSPAPVVPSKGSRFDSVGRVTLHPGQPCTSQIMFDFHGRGGRVIWMGAPKHETAILTEAVRRHEKVRINGVWRRGAHAGCAFVEVTHAVPEKKILGIF